MIVARKIAYKFWEGRNLSRTCAYFVLALCLYKKLMYFVEDSTFLQLQTQTSPWQSSCEWS